MVTLAVSRPGTNEVCATATLPEIVNVSVCSTTKLSWTSITVLIVLPLVAPGSKVTFVRTKFPGAARK